MLSCGIIATAGDCIYVVAVAALTCFVAGVLLGRSLPARTRSSQSGSANGRGDGDKKSHELYVGNLSYDTTETQLRKAFARFSKGVSVRIIGHRQSGESKGYGFVQVPGRDAAMAAKKGLNGTELNGRKLAVSEARKNSRSRRGKRSR